MRGLRAVWKLIAWRQAAAAAAVHLGGQHPRVASDPAFALMAMAEQRQDRQLQHQQVGCDDQGCGRCVQDKRVESRCCS